METGLGCALDLWEGDVLGSARSRGARRSPAQACPLTCASCDGLAGLSWALGRLRALSKSLLSTAAWYGGSRKGTLASRCHSCTFVVTRECHQGLKPGVTSPQGNLACAPSEYTGTGVGQLGALAEPCLVDEGTAGSWS